MLIPEGLEVRSQVRIFTVEIVNRQLSFLGQFVEGGYNVPTPRTGNPADVEVKIFTTGLFRLDPTNRKRSKLVCEAIVFYIGFFPVLIAPPFSA